MAPDQLAESLVKGQRRALAKGITLVENTRPEARAIANELVSKLLPKAGNSIRLGITGVPGVGKSTFIEALGLHLVSEGHKVAVLAVDPSSRISGGSILGDKVRMERLSREPNAFIRPSPSAGSLGGVTRGTRENMLLCEAAGFDVILIETVGVGQSEIAVGEMVDFFMVLLLPGAGDEIQGIKKGIIEMADALVVNKADGDMKKAASQACRYYRNAVHFSRPKYPHWSPPVLTASAAEQNGIAEAWEVVLQHRQELENRDKLAELRQNQTRLWFHSTLRDELLDRLYGDQTVAGRIEALTVAMNRQELSPHQCADEVVNLFLSRHG